MSRSEKDARYDRSEKGRARHRRYDARRPGGRGNDRRVYVGQYFVGMAPTAEQATDLTNQAREAL